MGFQQRDANAGAKERYIQCRRDYRYKVKMLWTGVERKKQGDAANNKYDDTGV